MSHQYRAWKDYLIRCVETFTPSSDPYQLIHTANMVGLFSCIFIKASMRGRLHSTHAGEVKRGMGGLHGNKVSLQSSLRKSVTDAVQGRASFSLHP